MKAIQWAKKRSVSLLAILIMGILILLPTGYEDALIYQGTERVRAKVLETNEDNIYNNGLIQSGEQECEVEILDGQFKGENRERYQYAERIAGSRQNFPGGGYRKCCDQP